MNGKGLTANQITAELLIQIPKRFRDTMAWRNNTGRGIGWSQIKAAIACLRRRDSEGALKFLTRPIGFGLVGSADILVVAAPGGRLIGLEVKTETDEQSPIQVAWQKRLEALGGAYIEARDVVATMAELGRIINGNC